MKLQIYSWMYKLQPAPIAYRNHSKGEMTEMSVSRREIFLGSLWWRSHARDQREDVMKYTSCS